MRAPDFWHADPGLWSTLLSPVAGAWTAAARIRAALSSPYRAPVPVICIGNLVAGGSGKTPVVISLARRLGSRGIAAHIVSRGYGGALSGPVRVDPERHDPAEVGDEALLLCETAPSWVARDRSAGVRAAAESGASLILLDDGFQNRTITKDLSLVVVDAEYGFGNGLVMPAGPLREPIAAGLARADAVVLLGNGSAPAAVQRTGLPILRAELAPIGGERFAGTRDVAFAGIGRPAKFFETLHAVGADLVATRAFPDHHVFIEAEIADLRVQADRGSGHLVTTAKDWVRLSPAQRADIAVLEVALHWQDPDQIDSLLAPFLAADIDANARRARRG